MSRITVFHLTPTRNLPMIEEEGLRTRADLSERFGPLEGIDLAAPGTYAHGKRITAWLDLEHARSQAAAQGFGLVTYSVDPAKCLATSGDPTDPEAYWASATSLKAVMDDAPAGIAVHTNRPVRHKFIEIKAPLVSDADLGIHAGLVNAVADVDRLSAKALMHLAIIASEGDFDSPEFTAACALAWRDTTDEVDLANELAELDPDKVASAALAEFGGDAPESVTMLRDVLDASRAWGEENGVEAGQALYARTALVLDMLTA